MGFLTYCRETRIRKVHKKQRDRLNCERLEDRHLLAIISGTVWQELNDDGINNPNEPGVAGVTVFLDHNRNDQIDSGEQTTVTNASGRYTFDVPEGDYNVATVPKSGWERVAMDRLIGMTAIHVWSYSFYYISEIDPDTGYSGQSKRINFPGNPLYEEMDYSGLAVDANHPGKFYSLLYEVRAGGSTTTFITEISCPPGADSCTTTSFTDTDYDSAELGGVAFDPTNPSLLYGISNDEDPDEDSDCYLWAFDRNTGLTVLGAFTTLQSDFGYTYCQTGDLTFDRSGNLYMNQTETFSPNALVSLDKTNGQILREYPIDKHGILDSAFEHDALTNSFFAIQWDAAKKQHLLVQYDPLTDIVTPIRPVEDVPKALTRLPGYLNRPVSPTDTVPSNGIDFGHRFNGAGVSGTVYNDLNSNGTQEAWELRLPGWNVFLDANLNGIRDGAEPVTTTNSAGGYSFPNLQPGVYTVAIENQSQWHRTYPDNFPLGPRHHVNLTRGQFFTADFGVAQAVGVEGSLYEDVNANGMHDEAEGALTDATVYVDQNRNGVLDQHFSFFPSTNPNPIADNATTRLPIFVGGLGDRISDVNVQMDISHEKISDLDIALVSSNGTRIELLSDLGASADNRLAATWLDDEATSKIDKANAPFTGAFRPEDGFLSDFDGQRPGGTWYLEVTDDSSVHQGTVNSWSLQLTTGDFSTQPNSEGHYSFTDLPPGPLEIHTEFSHEWTRTEPDFRSPQVVASFENLWSGFKSSGGDGSRNSAKIVPGGLDGGQILQAGDWIHGSETTQVRKGDTISVDVRMGGDGQGRLTYRWRCLVRVRGRPRRSTGHSPITATRHSRGIQPRFVCDHQLGS